MSDETTSDIQNELQELPDISDFTPTGPGADLLNEINNYLEIVNTVRDENEGLPPETVDKIEEQFLVDRVRHSATIEGVNLDRRETLHVLTTGQIIEGKRRPSQETKNLGDALEVVGQLVEVEAIREVDIRNIHAVLLKDLDDNAGRYRPHDVRITNASYRPPEHLDVPRLMHSLVEKLASPPEGTDRFTVGVYAHWAMARIHPFVDGNGRMARIMQDLYFLRHRLVPTPVPYQDVDDYYGALEKADSGNTGPFVELIAGYTLSTLRKYRAAIEEVQQTDDWLDDLISTANESIRDTEHSLFTRYSQQMSEIRDTFSGIATRISRSIPELDCRFREFGGIDFTRFREIKSRGTASRTWDFGLTFVLGDREVRFIFWHGRHRSSESDSVKLGRDPILLVSIQENDKYVILNDTDEMRISLRAIGISDGQFVRVRNDPVQEVNEADYGISASAICRDFVSEVVQGVLGLG